MKRTNRISAERHAVQAAAIPRDWKRLGLAVIAAAGLLAGPLSDVQAAPVEVRVTIENLAPTDGTLITPVWVGFHDGSIDMFNRGEAASAALERLAEDGDAAPLSSAFDATGSGSAQATILSGGEIPPFAPGQRASHTVWLDPDAPASRYFSYAAMVIPSNDAFIGNDDPMRHPVFDGAGRFVGGSFTVMGREVWDAGTEVNDEAAMNTAFLGQETPDTGATESGAVMPHAGFKAAGMGGVLDGSFAGFSFSSADFKAAGYAIARITLSVPQAITVTVENLAPTDGTLIAPMWIGFHDGSFEVFDSGAPANAVLERLAEDGEAGPLTTAFADSSAGSVQGTIASGGPVPPFAPGQRMRMTFLVDPMAPSSRFLSYAAMVIPSNDAFIGNDSPTAIRIFDDAGNFLGASVEVAGEMVHDAGTEVNDEAAANTAFLGQAAPDTGMSEGGVIGAHAGFKPAGSGGILDGSFAGFSFSAADFKAPDYKVARITVSLEPVITRFQLSKGLARLAWAGGEGAFTVQWRESLSTGAWEDVLTTTEALADLPAASAMGFFRVMGR